MDFRIQRFLPGHPLYSDASVTNTDPLRGIVGTFKPVFGQCVFPDGEVMHYTMERKDTLIPTGIYDYDLYFSPHNKMKVPRLIKDEKGVDISMRELEHHIVNWLWSLKGCTGHGLQIDLLTSSLVHSRVAFLSLMDYVNIGTGGKITYENYVENLNS